MDKLKNDKIKSCYIFLFVTIDQIIVRIKLPSKDFLFIISAQANCVDFNADGLHYIVGVTKADLYA